MNYASDPPPPPGKLEYPTDPLEKFSGSAQASTLQVGVHEHVIFQENKISLGYTYTCTIILYAHC